MFSENKAMTRREWLALCAAGSVARGAPIQYREYARCLPDYISALARDAYDRRNSDLARLTTATAIRDRQRWVREAFWRMVGGMPERTPLEQKSLGGFEREGYRVEKIVYQSQPGLHVP